MKSLCKKIITFITTAAICISTLIDASNKVFAIRACKSNDAKVVPFSKPKLEQKTTLSSNNKNLVETIRTLMKDIWKPDARYKVTGFYISENKTMVFDLS